MLRGTSGVSARTKARRAGAAGRRPSVDPTWSAGVKSVTSPVLALRRDEALQGVAGFFVVHLEGRRLHEVLAGRGHGATEAAILGQLGAAHGVDDDPRRVGGVVHF